VPRGYRFYSAASASLLGIRWTSRAGIAPEAAAVVTAAKPIRTMAETGGTPSRPAPLTALNTVKESPKTPETPRHRALAP